MFKGLTQKMNLGIIAILVGFGGLSLARADGVCESYAFHSAEKNLAETFVVSELVYWLPQYLQSTVIDCRYFSQDDILEYSTIISWLGFDALDYFEVGVSFTVTPTGLYYHIGYRNAPVIQHMVIMGIVELTANFIGQQ